MSLVYIMARRQRSKVLNFSGTSILIWSRSKLLSWDIVDFGRPRNVDYPQNVWSRLVRRLKVWALALVSPSFNRSGERSLRLLKVNYLWHTSESWELACLLPLTVVLRLPRITVFQLLSTAFCLQRSTISCHQHSTAFFEPSFKEIAGSHHSLCFWFVNHLRQLSNDILTWTDIILIIFNLLSFKKTKIRRLLKILISLHFG